MPTTKKIYAVQNMEEKAKLVKGLVLTDYSGLKVAQMSELRKELKKSGAEYEVVKNNLLARALKHEPESGPTAALWLYKEDFSPLKTLAAFIAKNELPKIKIGFWDNQPLGAERVLELANLPGIDGLRAKLVGTFNSPIYRLANSLNWNLKKLVFILKGVKVNG